MREETAPDSDVRSSRWRVAFVVEATTGGVARHLLDLVGGLDLTRFAPFLYLSFEREDSWREPLRALAGQGIFLREIPMQRLPNPEAVRQLSWWARHDQIDLLHLHSAKAGYLGRLAARNLGIPTIYTPHAFPFQRTTDWLRPLYRRLEQALALETAAIICVSTGEYEEAVAAGLPRDRLLIIPNGLDLTQWPPLTAEERREARAHFGVRAEEIVIGALGRFVSQKGYDLLLLAADEVLTAVPWARLVLWGDGPQRRSLERLAARLRLPRLQFLPATATPRQAYAAMDIFCAPSRWEGAPYSTLEAMACELPIVASDVSGHLEQIVHGETGLLVPAELPGPLAGALETLLADEDVRHAYGQAGRRHVAHAFPATAMLEATTSLYTRVLSAFAASQVA